MNKVGIIYNALIPEAKDLSAAILDRLDLPADSWIATADDEATLLQQSKETDLVITVRGDGTILRVVRMPAPSGSPVCGLNMGRLGFMPGLRAAEARVHHSARVCTATGRDKEGRCNGLELLLEEDAKFE